MSKINKKYSVGIDIGGTKMRAVLWNGEKVVVDDELGTPSDTVEHLCVMVKALVDPLIERAQADKVKVAGIGIGLPGVIETATGKLYGAPNLAYAEGVAIGAKFAAMLGTDPVIDNDANTFLRGEAIAGAARGFQSVYALTIGTGIGGGWYLDNRIFRGAYGGGSEPGAMVVDLPSGLDLEGIYQRLTQNNQAKMSQEAIFGDVLAERAFEEFGRNLGVALANIVNLIDPEAIVLGGSVMKAADLFLKSAKTAMKEFIIFPPSARKVKILKSKLGDNAGAVGAALLVEKLV